MTTTTKWKQLTKGEADTLFRGITNGGRSITTANLDGYLKNGAQRKAIDMWKFAKGKNPTVDKKRLVQHLTQNLALPLTTANLVWEEATGYSNGNKITIMQWRDWAEINLRPDFIKDTFNLH